MTFARLFAYERGRTPGLGAELDGRLYDATGFLAERYHAQGLMPLVETGRLSDAAQALAANVGRLKELAPGFAWALPLRRPHKIIALVQNYQDHAAEFGATAPPEPVWFSKLNSSLTPHESEIVLPAWLESRVDHEVELAVILGRGGKEIAQEKALDYVAGYSIMNDVSARHLQKSDRENKHPWLRCKNFDTFTPFGPCLVAAAAVKDPQALTIACRVNGEVRQNGNTKQMIHPVAKLIAVLSRYMTLEAGDVISTGTPAGVGKLVDGDVVECEIEGVGLLRNRVVKR
ncbi:5-oxopent-3-ene-1,2,5-tricarboxylate decarboxylase / 2-hydroxyhepta-2,4-diene-1,7-dioate isomerase [Planctomycetaceae bacterium]|nr:5-oxopent-3-ene-1,2,5-tricarboxylate decarboxylase / 2-hydroxyhepta-2,4-diene-1,7-dioate isomerase [Planctomycetaceae bacterium]